MNWLKVVSYGYDQMSKSKDLDIDLSTHHSIAPKLAIKFESPTHGILRTHVGNVLHHKSIQNQAGHSIVSFSLAIFSTLR